MLGTAACREGICEQITARGAPRRTPARARRAAKRIRGARTHSSRLRNALRFHRVHERDDRTAESASGHAGTERTLVAGDIHGHVELGHGHLVIVAQRVVRCVEQFAGGLHVTFRESAHEIVHTADLGDHVTHALPHGLVVESVEHAVERGGRIRLRIHQICHLAQIRDAQNARGLLAGRTPLGILSVVELVRRARVKHEQLKAVAFEVEDLLLHAVHRAQARSGNPNGLHGRGCSASTRSGQGHRWRRPPCRSRRQSPR